MSSRLFVVGILGLQGDITEMRHYFENLQLDQPLQIRILRSIRDFDLLDLLVIPGGESGTILRVLKRRQMLASCLRFLEQGGAFFGTCAGLIVYSELLRIQGIQSYRYERNADGRQLRSQFKQTQNDAGNRLNHPYVRAPRILEILNSEFEPLFGEMNDLRVVRSKKYRSLLLTGHPELNHSYDQYIRDFLNDVISNSH